MNTKDIFDIKDGIEKDIVDNEKKKKELEDLKRELMDYCAHELVFKFKDNYSRKMVVYGNYYCPACGKIIRVFFKDQVEKSPFKNSRIIPLDNIFIPGTQETMEAIRREVINNMDYYYDPSIDSEELERKMETTLKDYECNSSYLSMELRRRL